MNCSKTASMTACRCQNRKNGREELANGERNKKKTQKQIQIMSLLFEINTNPVSINHFVLFSILFDCSESGPVSVVIAIFP